MARLKACDGFEIEFFLKLGIQVFLPVLYIRIWKDGKAYLVPESGSQHCDPDDYENYRFISPQNIGEERFFPCITSYYQKITSGNHKAKAGFEDLLEERNEVLFSNEGNSDIVNISIHTNEDLYDIDFKNHKKFLEDTIEFNFTSTKQNFIEFYKDFVQEREVEIQPKRVLLTTKKIKEDGEEPWKEEVELIKRQIHLDTDKPVIIIDHELLIYASKKDIHPARDCIEKLLPSYKLIIFDSGCRADEQEQLKINFPEIPILEHGCYPKNKEFIYLRCDSLPRDTPSLMLFCCLDRAVTSIWFTTWCKNDWYRVYKTIIQCIDNPPPLSSLENDGEFYCPF